RSDVRRVVAGVDAGSTVPIAELAATHGTHGHDRDHRWASRNHDGSGRDGRYRGSGYHHDIRPGAVVIAAVALPIADGLDPAMHRQRWRQFEIMAQRLRSEPLHRLGC